MRTKTIDISTYKTHLTVFLGGRYADISHWLDENISDDKYECDCVKTHFDNAINKKEAAGTFVWYEREFFVWVRRSHSIPELVHELYHATNYILTQCGVAHSGADEPYAYLLEHLTREAMKKEPSNTK